MVKKIVFGVTVCTDISFEKRPSPIAHRMLFEHKSCYPQWHLPCAVFQSGVGPHCGCAHHSGAVAPYLAPLRTTAAPASRILFSS